MRAEFVHDAPAMRVLFGDGALARVGEEVDRLGLRRVLVLSTPGRVDLAREVAGSLGERCAGMHPEARMHVPVEVTDRAAARADEVGADGCVAVGGGSTVGLGKAVALRRGLPFVAVPTTYSGSEMTPVWGLTADGVKRTGRDPVVLARSVVYDPRLSTGLPVATSVTSGVNALAHAAEALYAPDGSPVLDLMAAEGARSLLSALPRIVADPGDRAARTDALRGAWLCGTVLASTTMSLHHKLCHVLGGTFGLPHAETHTVVLPHALAVTLPAAPDATAALAPALGDDDVPGALWTLVGRLGGPVSLAALGFPSDGIAETVRQVLAAPYPTPRAVTAADVTALLERAVAGEPPA